MGKAEAHVETYLVKRIKAIGGKTRKARWIARKGCPDQRVMLPEPWRMYLRILTIPPLVAVEDWPAQNPWVECKSLDGEADDIQIREHARMRALGELVLVINTRELVDFYFPLEIPDGC